MPSNTHIPNSLIIVDDSSVDLKINSRIASLTKLFKQILCFNSAEAALDFLVENLNNPEVCPVLILLDIQMPEMDGFEFLKRYERFPRSFKEKSAVIMLSSTDDLGDMTRVESDKNVVRLLKKPLQIGELKELLTRIYDL
jgi:CheY-like chemotaxis protein